MKWNWHLLIILVLIIGFVFLRPISTTNLISHPSPLASFDDAVKKIENFKEKESLEVNPVCKSRFYTHGKKTSKVIVFFHGYTNCPEQFDSLGKLFFEKGYNVFIPRYPFHGFANRLDTKHGQLKAEDFVAFVDQIIDMAKPLGNELTVSGISVGGVLTGFAVQNREEVDQAVLIAPDFSYYTYSFLRLPLTNYLLTIPNEFKWWSEKYKENPPGPPYGYPRYATRVIGESFRLGFAVSNASVVKKPYGKIIIVTSAYDHGVNNSITYNVAKDWKKNGAEVIIYEFAEDLKVEHDMIDPNQPTQKIDVVYPQILRLLED